MIARKLIAATLFAALTCGAAFAQAQQPATNPLKPNTPPPAAAPAGKAAEPAKPAAKAAEPAKPAAKAAEPAKPAAKAAESAKPAAKAAEPAKPAPAAKAAEPAKPAAKAEPAKAAAATGKKVDLNTATAEELDALPQIGAARSKAIIEARAKGKFKNWDDFVKRNVVPSNAEGAIKDLVKF